MGAFGNLLDGGVGGVWVGEGGGKDAVALGNHVGQTLGGCCVLLRRHCHLRSGGGGREGEIGEE